MSKQKLLTIAVAGLVILNLGLVGFLFFAKPRHLPGGRPMEGPNQGPRQIIIDKLNFDGAQTKHYEVLVKEHQENIKKLAEEVQSTKNTLFGTLAGESEYGKDSLINRLGDLQKEIEMVHYEHFIAIRGICTPNQLTNYRQLTEELASFFAPGKNPPPPPRGR